MDLLLTRDGASVVLTVNGRIDTVTSPEFEQCVISTLDEAPPSLTFDFAGVEYISSAGLRVLMTAMKALGAHGHTLTLRGVQPEVLKILTLTGFTELLQIESIADAR